MAIYLKADGANGNVSTEGYQNWVNIQEYHFSGISQAAEQRTGRMQDRVRGGPNFGLITLQKVADTSTPFWFNYAHSNNVIPQVEIDFVTAGNPPFTYQKITLTNAFVTHYSQEHQAEKGGPPYEYLVLAYDTLEATYTPRGADNSIGNPSSVGYNVATGLKM